MKVTLLQMDIAKGDVRENIRRAQTLIDSAEQSDLYVLPEMFSTGFSDNPSETAEEQDAESVRWMTSVAVARKAWIGGSIAVRVGESYRNRFVLVSPEGKLTVADKRHLFSMGNESKMYTAGKDKVIVDINGVRCLLLVCYDLRFPVWSRCVDAQYDAIIYVANWPMNRIRVWDVLLRARAIENQCYVVAVNRVGQDGGIVYNGHSVVVDARGREVVECEEAISCCATADIFRERVDEFREKFPVLRDADQFVLGGA